MPIIRKIIEIAPGFNVLITNQEIPDKELLAKSIGMGNGAMAPLYNPIYSNLLKQGDRAQNWYYNYQTKQYHCTNERQAVVSILRELDIPRRFKYYWYAI